MSQRYKTSEALLQRALKVIPLGSQTFSKSSTQYPYGVSPFFITRGLGSHVWDADGNEYVDFVNSLAAITLGHKDPEVDAAVMRQLQQGVIFTLPHPIEIEVAEKIIEMVPCAEMVRFGKNGSDATAGAIRLARAYTGRDHVAVCGYHGWQDWYIGSTSRNRGVPKATSDLTHKFTYNNLDSLIEVFNQWPNEIAAVILEPANVVMPKQGYLEAVKEIASKHGALLIFDETITGFRYANGGAQELFGVVPDLATFGKGIANGYPISAIAGRQVVMRLLEEVFFSFTFGGETLSLAASLATMTKLQHQPVVQTIRAQGKKLMDGVTRLIERHDVGHILQISGDPSWSFLTFNAVTPNTEWEIKTLFLQEIFVRGVLCIGTHNMSYSHSDADIDCLLRAYDEVFPIIKTAVDNNELGHVLQCKSLQPLFKVR